MKNRLKQLKRNRHLIAGSVDRLEQAEGLYDSPSLCIMHYKIFMKRESSLLLKRSLSLFWNSLLLWGNLRLSQKLKK